METEVLEDIKIDEKIIKQVLEPGKYNVIFVNDNETPMEWVVEVLTESVSPFRELSTRYYVSLCMTKVRLLSAHMSYEIAEQKSNRS